MRAIPASRVRLFQAAALAVAGAAAAAMAGLAMTEGMGSSLSLLLIAAACAVVLAGSFSGMQAFRRLEGSSRQVAVRQAELRRMEKSLLERIESDLVSPLAMVSALSSAVISDWDGLPDASKRSLLEKIHTQTERLGIIASNLVPNAHSKDREVVAVRLLPIVDEVITELEHLRPGGGFNVRVPEDLVARVQPWGLKRALECLVLNAVTYAREGRVTVRTGVSGSRITISVDDEGPGIIEEERDLIFEPFYRSNHNDEAGLGLGLWTAKNLMESMGGRVCVESQPTRGATFTLVLPGESSDPDLAISPDDVPEAG